MPGSLLPLCHTLKDRLWSSSLTRAAICVRGGPIDKQKIQGQAWLTHAPLAPRNSCHLSAVLRKASRLGTSVRSGERRLNRHCLYALNPDSGWTTRKDEGFWTIVGSNHSSLCSRHSHKVHATLSSQHGRFPGLPSGISSHYLSRGNLSLYKSVLLRVCYACQLKDALAFITVKLLFRKNRLLLNAFQGTSY